MLSIDRFVAAAISPVPFHVIARPFLEKAGKPRDLRRTSNAPKQVKTPPDHTDVGMFMFQLLTHTQAI